jgi:inosose dehydratase
MNQIKLGIAPIGWSNDDMPELGGHISFEQCIKEMAEAGYQGCEVGNKFPRDPEVLHTALLPYQLSVASAWYSTYFTEPERTQKTIDGFIQHMQFLHAMGAKVIVVCECGHGIQGKSLPVLSHKPVFTETQWQMLINGLHHIGQLAIKNNMTIVYHHHMGTGVQLSDEIDRLMELTDPALVSLLLDTGHLYFSGSNPYNTLQKHGSRIKHVHLKDIRDDILKLTMADNLSFLDAVRSGVFTVPSDGCIDFAPIFHSLLDLNYQGWWIVEAEQDPDKANPLIYAKMARDFIRRSVGL